MPSKKPRITVYLTPEEHAQISEFAASADLGRLGGLFKLALIEGSADKFTLQRLLRDIEVGQRELKAAAMRIR